jgi:hypothetical protein
MKLTGWRTDSLTLEAPCKTESVKVSFVSVFVVLVLTFELNVKASNVTPDLSLVLIRYLEARILQYSSRRHRGQRFTAQNGGSMN